MPARDRFTLENASKDIVCVLTARVPWISLRAKHTYVPGTPLQAASMAQDRFVSASPRGAPKGSCEPVMITGLVCPCSMYESAAAV